jgi:hypothetical protein
VSEWRVLSIEHRIRSPWASINAFKIPKALVRRAYFFPELCDEVGEFYRGIDHSKSAFSAFPPQIQMCPVCRNGSTTREIGEPYDRFHDRLSGSVLPGLGHLKFSRPTNISIRMNSPKLISCEFMCFDCRVRFRFKYELGTLPRGQEVTSRCERDFSDR